MLRVQKVQEHTPPNYTVLGWDVTDIRTEMKGLMERGLDLSGTSGLSRMSWGPGQHRPERK